MHNRLQKSSFRTDLTKSVWVTSRVFLVEANRPLSSSASTRGLQKTKHLRHLGANALEICYVADGTTDAFIDIRGKLRVTDVAAAYLILLEAGGTMTSPEGKELSAPLTPTQQVSFIAAANKQLYEVIRRFLV